MKNTIIFLTFGKSNKPKKKTRGNWFEYEYTHQLTVLIK